MGKITNNHWDIRHSVTLICLCYQTLRSDFMPKVILVLWGTRKSQTYSGFSSLQTTGALVALGMRMCLSLLMWGSRAEKGSND